MLKYTFILLAGLLLVISLLAGACTKPAATTTPTQTSALVSTSTQIIKMRMGSPNTPNSPTELLNKRWIEKIQNETNGRVQITLYSSGTLIDAFSAYDLLQADVADITPLITGIPGVPFYISGSTNIFVYGTNLDGARYVFENLWKKFPELQAEYKEVKTLFSQGGTDQYIHSKKPIRTLADLKGMQLQPSPGLTVLLNRMGATGSPMPGSEMYPSLEKGILDGAFMTAESLTSNSLAEVTQYSTNLHLPGPPTTITAMNMDAWDKLPPDIQKVFEDSIPWTNKEMDKVLKEEEQKAIDSAKAKGHEFIELSPADLNKFYSIMEQLSLEKVEELNAKGLPGTDIFKEVRRLVDQYNAQSK